VRFNNDLRLGTRSELRYAGRGTLYGKGDIYVDANLLPVAGSKFPTTAAIGLLATRNMFLATGSGSSQLSLAGAFYAQGKIVSQKQNQIAGTFVANFYDMGNNVPNIYQVPALVNNMPPAMPGDKGVYTIKIRTWRRR
jgi:hypothetical protein